MYRRSPGVSPGKRTPSAKVEVFLMEGCGWCEKLKREIPLKKGKAKVKITNDVHKGLKRLKEVGRPDVRGFPVVIVNGKYIGGYTEGVKYFKQLSRSK